MRSKSLFLILCTFSLSTVACKREAPGLPTAEWRVQFPAGFEGATKPVLMDGPPWLRTTPSSITLLDVELQFRDLGGGVYSIWQTPPQDGVIKFYFRDRCTPEKPARLEMVSEQEIRIDGKLIFIREGSDGS